MYHILKTGLLKCIIIRHDVGVCPPHFQFFQLLISCSEPLKCTAETTACLNVQSSTLNKEQKARLSRICVIKALIRLEDKEDEKSC